MKEISIAGRKIGREHKPFIIAEMSGNHNQSLDRAKSIIDAAAEAGADAIKLQTYTADTMTINVNHGNFNIGEKFELWKGKNLYDLYKLAYTPWEWHKPLFDHAKSLGLIAFSSPFDASAVDFLEELEVPVYKVASFENTDHPLLKKMAQTGKPIIMSTGMTTVADIDESVRVLRENGCKELILLKCTSTYPATPENSNIQTIPHMSATFGVQVGLSDHTMGIGVPVAAIALGATVVEKHFTLRRADGGVDSAFSLEPEELKALVIESERAHQALGKVHYGILDAEKSSKDFKRSIYVVQDVEQGTALTEENIRVIRPGDGLEPKYLDMVMGKKVKKPMSKGTPLKLEDLM